MIFSAAVGVVLKSEEERALVRAAALKCGLDPVDFDGASVGSALDIAQPTLIVTDEALQTGECSTDGNDPWVDDAPLVILVRDEGDGIASNDDTDYSWVMRRPLQMEGVESLLRQALLANRLSARRHHAILEELHRSRSIFDSVCNGITISDANLPDLPLVYVNPAFEKMTGYALDEVCGRNCRFLQGRDHDQPGLTKIREAIREKRDARVLLKNYRKDGTAFWNELYMSPILDLEGRLTHFAGIQNDVTAQVESANRLQYLAHHDALTGLANRGLLIEQLSQAILRAGRSGGKLAVLFVDLNNFKHVNDVFGHDAGDNLLGIVAQRLKDSTRGGETVARLGGDEFVIVLEELSDQRRAADVVLRLTRKVGEAVDLMGQRFHPCASVGMALFPEDGDSAEALLKVADFKMYLAKHAARTDGQCEEENTLSAPRTRSEGEIV